MRFPEFEVYDRTENTYYLGRIKESGYRNEYELRVGLHPDYPDFKPSVLVTSPKILRMKTGEAINDIGTSHDWHTYGKAGNGGRLSFHTWILQGTKNKNGQLSRETRF
jgi:hypothetical protein